jgi:hypothetical protein
MGPPRKASSQKSKSKRGMHHKIKKRCLNPRNSTSTGPKEGPGEIAATKKRRIKKQIAEQTNINHLKDCN